MSKKKPKPKKQATEIRSDQIVLDLSDGETLLPHGEPPYLRAKGGFGITRFVALSEVIEAYTYEHTQDEHNMGGGWCGEKCPGAGWVVRAKLRDQWPPVTVISGLPTESTASGVASILMRSADDARQYFQKPRMRSGLILLSRSEP